MWPGALTLCSSLTQVLQKRGWHLWVGELGHTIDRCIKHADEMIWLWCEHNVPCIHNIYRLACSSSLSFVVDLSLFNRDDAVHSLYRDPIICCHRENILFAASPMACSMAEGGNLTIITVLISQLRTGKRLGKILWLLLLLIQCGDVETNPGPLDSASCRCNVHVRPQ